MTDYNFERLTVLVVEDSLFIRSLLITGLRTLGVGNVVALDHGGEAIELLKMIAIDPMIAGVQTVDIIISNWQMSPVDGMMLLRWVRRHKESPDRFVPFVLMTAYSEPARVAEARDLGVTEFLAKPFSLRAVSERLVSIIEKQRQFVHTKTYFGPDRRRRNAPVSFEDRRTLTDKSEGVEVIYG